jgi:hypothetical protein
VEELTITNSKKGTAGLELNKEDAHWFFDVKRIVRREFVLPNTMVNPDFYCDVLRHLSKNM